MADEDSPALFATAVPKAGLTPSLQAIAALIDEDDDDAAVPRAFTGKRKFASLGTAQVQLALASTCGDGQPSGERRGEAKRVKTVASTEGRAPWDEADPLVAMVLSLESHEDLEDAVEEHLPRSITITTEQVLRALVRWKDVEKAAQFFACWAQTGPLFGCDAQQCFAAVPRLRLSNNGGGLWLCNSSFYAAARIIAAAFPHKDQACKLASEIEWDPKMRASEFLMAGGWAVDGVQDG